MDNERQTVSSGKKLVIFYVKSLTGEHEEMKVFAVNGLNTGTDHHIV